MVGWLWSATRGIDLAGDDLLFSPPFHQLFPPYRDTVCTYLPHIISYIDVLVLSSPSTLTKGRAIIIQQNADGPSYGNSNIMTSLASSGFNPFSSWQCPQCRRSYVKAETTTATTVLFYRGTCRHDICVACIAALSSLTSKKVKREEVDNQPIIVTVTCPINFDHPASGRRRNGTGCGCSRTCRGQFRVDMANIPMSISDNNMVIELSDDEGKEAVRASAEGIVKVKEEYVDEHLNQNQQHQQSSGQGIVTIKTENIHPTSILSSLNATISCSLPSSTTSIAQVLSTPNTNLIMNSANPGKKLCDLKPLFEIGDNVYAAWWDPNTDTKRRNEAEWFSGVVVSYETSIGASSKYGPTRLYHIMFSDNDELDNIEDYYVFSKTDYELIAKCKTPDNYIGVRNRVDAKSTDEWAKIVGWYEITGEDGKAQSFSLLTDAMRAHDAIVVRKHGARVKRSFLNIPEDYPELFAPTNIEALEGRVEEDESVNARNTATRQVRANIVSPESLTMVGIKRDPNGYDDETAVHEDRTSENKRLRQELESRRLDPSLEAKLLLTDFWSVNKDHIQFDEQAFMSNPLFHLNSFVRSEKKINEGFSEFIREGIGTPGFLSLPNSLDIEKIADWTHKELREELTKMNHSDWGATATATWLKKATVGSFVIMRHCYPKCKFCPKRLFVDGSYIGPVYVIGIITKKVLPWSEEERRIADTITGAYNLCTVSSEKMGYINELKHNFCTVSWEKMGYINELKESTKKYLSKVVQPTLQQICENAEKRFDGGGTSDSIRRDLWKHAREKISSEQFPDQFQHEGIQDPAIS